jgi:predicted lipoprotein with Yx(FWY)xxD motif
MKAISVLLIAGLLALAGCGDDDDSGGSNPQAPTDDAATQEKKEEGAIREEKAAPGTTITVRDSQFGPMLFDSRKQAIYIFENDSKGKTVCYGECAEAWPPVLTDGEPRAAKGVKASLLGTVKRRDGKLQVTYAGQPLYFYDHEGPGEVRCHNVDLNGGLWWVVGPDGKRRP